MKSQDILSWKISGDTTIVFSCQVHDVKSTLMIVILRHAAAKVYVLMVWVTIVVYVSQDLLEIIASSLLMIVQVSVHVI